MTVGNKNFFYGCGALVFSVILGVGIAMAQILTTPIDKVDDETGGGVVGPKLGAGAGEIGGSSDLGELNPIEGEVAIVADGCVSGDCTGYTKTATQCSGKTFIRCPFDTSKYFCIDDDDGGLSCNLAIYKYSCTGSFESAPASGDSCNGKYKACSCSGVYSWNSSSGACVINTVTCGDEFKYSCTGLYEVAPTSKSDACGGKYRYCTCNKANYCWSQNYGCIKAMNLDGTPVAGVDCFIDGNFEFTE